MAQLLVNLRFNFSTNVKIVIVRHGQSIWNKHRKWAGWSDVRLSSTGIKQAKQCGKLLKQKGFVFEEAYCSVLTRSIQTLNHILDQMQLHYVPVHKSWRLNEKHYGSLTGQGKVQITQKYGQQKVAEWRRSFDKAPPPVDVHDERHPSNDKRYAEVEKSQLPSSQNQIDVIKRLQPLWENQMKNRLISGKNLIVSCHGGSARGLVKLISNLPDQDIKELNLPHTTPLVYTLEVQQNRTLSVKSMQYIGDLNQITAKMQKIKNQTKLTEV